MIKVFVNATLPNAITDALTIATSLGTKMNSLICNIDFAASNHIISEIQNFILLNRILPITLLLQPMVKITHFWHG